MEERPLSEPVSTGNIIHESAQPRILRGNYTRLIYMFYTHSTLDRADHLRKDGTQIQTLREHPDARLVPVWHLQLMVARTSDTTLPQALLLPADCALPKGQTVFLGLQGTSPLFAVDISSLDELERDALADKAFDSSPNTEPC